jgi:hypothetical protein
MGRMDEYFPSNGERFSSILHVGWSFFGIQNVFSLFKLFYIQHTYGQLNL